MTVNAGVTEERLQAACQKLGSEAVVSKECMPKPQVDDAGAFEFWGMVVLSIVLMLLWSASFIGGLRSCWLMLVRPNTN